MRKLKECEERIIKKIYYTFKKKRFFEKKISYKVLALILHIKCESIVSLEARGDCITIFTKDFLYKMQIYGESVKRDICNRKLFFDFEGSMISPIKVKKNHPFTIKMPILDCARTNEEDVKHILEELRKTGSETPFRMQNYPLLIEGINIIGYSRSGERAVKKLQTYFKEKEGTLVREGIVHGDFHRGNILYRGERPVLIDFDCARQRDIQDIDVLYYILEEERYKNRDRRPWMNGWLKIYKNTSIIYKYKCLEQIEIDLKFGLVLLLLERLAHNHREDDSFVKQNKAVLEKISREIYLL